MNCWLVFSVLLFTTWCTVFGQTTMHAGDMAVLNILNQRFAPSMWTNGITCDKSTTTGVVCDSNGRVTRLYMNRQTNKPTKSGSLPSDIGNLTELTIIWMQENYNNLKGVLPPELGKLKKLKTLFLYSNSLSGSIPPEIGQMAQLESLTLYINSLSGPIPKEIGQLPRIKRINLSQNKLSGTIPPELGNLGTLINLWLFQNSLSGNIPRELGNLSQLQIIYLDKNPITGTIPIEFCQFTGLKFLKLGPSITGEIPDCFSQRNLKICEIKGTRLCWKTQTSICSQNYPTCSPGSSVTSTTLARTVKTSSVPLMSSTTVHRVSTNTPSSSRYLGSTQVNNSSVEEGETSLINDNESEGGDTVVIVLTVLFIVVSIAALAGIGALLFRRYKQRDLLLKEKRKSTVLDLSKPRPSDETQSQKDATQPALYDDHLSDTQSRNNDNGNEYDQLNDFLPAETQHTGTEYDVLDQSAKKPSKPHNFSPTTTDYDLIEPLNRDKERKVTLSDLQQNQSKGAKRSGTEYGLLAESESIEDQQREAEQIFNDVLGE